jgi:CubicO group peptidase (beta-lactamase class C family)
MSSLVTLGLLALNLIPSTNKATNCPLFGPIYPVPSNVAANSGVQAALADLGTAFAALEKVPRVGEKSSYSIQVFSGSTSTPLFERYYTASNLANINSTGVRQVDADTVYRIGSISKIFTIYTFLIKAGDKYFSHPVTEFIPELAALDANRPENAITNVAWGDVTIGQLASHMAGISPDSKRFDPALEMHLTYNRLCRGRVPVIWWLLHATWTSRTVQSRDSSMWLFSTMWPPGYEITSSYVEVTEPEKL